MGVAARPAGAWQPGLRIAGVACPSGATAGLGRQSISSTERADGYPLFPADGPGHGPPCRGNTAGDWPRRAACGMAVGGQGGVAVGPVLAHAAAASAEV
jgi:hypothetical protein